MTHRQRALDRQLGTARVCFDGRVLRVATGRIERAWRWTGRGFATVEIRQLPGETAWSAAADQDTAGADWILPVEEERNPEGVLGEIACERSDDDGFTSEHLAFRADIAYPAVRLEVRFTVWAWPGAPGIRTQLFIRALEGFRWNGDLSRQEAGDEAARVTRLNNGQARQERLPCDFAGTRRRYIGYALAHQQRNDTFTESLKEHARECAIPWIETCDWASVAMVERGDTALTLVKESHLAFNAPGHDTGLFRCRPGIGLESLGWGVLPSEIGPDWTPAWATWCLVHGSAADERETALKTMDRIRYPVRPQDVFIQSNTWGSSAGFLAHREAASEASVLKELESASDLGIDLVQIDDGWQGNGYTRWTPCPERYPGGWRRVRARAEQLGLRLGLWASIGPGRAIPLEDLVRSHEEGGFVWYKLDFARFQGRADIEEVLRKARAFLLRTDHRARINWDGTESVPRFGYWFAREYGAIYAANRKPAVPKTTVYRPHTVLRDLWEFSRFLNLLKILGPVQNVERVDQTLSDAHLHGHAYGAAAALFSLPTFFQQTALYNEAARREIRPLLALHRRYREQIRNGITYPIGERPDGASWTGFQNHDADGGAGLLLIFRELANTEESASIPLRFAAGRRMQCTDLLTGETAAAPAHPSGAVTFRIPRAPGFRFLRYELGS